MRSFAFIARHDNDPTLMALIIRLSTKMDPSPYWSKTGKTYTEDDFIHLYDANVSDSNDVVAWGTSSNCDQSFYDTLGLWGSSTYNAFWCETLNVTLGELFQLKQIITVRLYAPNLWDPMALPIGSLASELGLCLMPNRS